MEQLIWSLGILGGVRNWCRQEGMLLAALIICSISVASQSATASEASTQSATYAVHGQIVILGDDEFTSANGVVSGNGTYDNPYVIEGWDIDISGTDPDIAGPNGGISIGNTEAYLVVRDVRIHGDYEPIDTLQGSYTISGNPAITLSGGANVRIEDCTLTNTTDGIVLRDMLGVSILGNTVVGNGHGIRIDRSSNINIEGNHVALSQFGNVLLTWISNSVIKNNTITDSDDWVGMDLYSCDNCDVLNNTISHNPSIGLNIGFCRDCTVIGNTISHNRIGIYIYYEEEVTLEENVFAGNEKDIEDLSDDDLPLVPLIAPVLIVVVVAVLVLMKRSQKKGSPP